MFAIQLALALCVINVRGFRFKLIHSLVRANKLKRYLLRLPLTVPVHFAKQTFLYASKREQYLLRCLYALIHFLSIFLANTPRWISACLFFDESSKIMSAFFLSSSDLPIPLCPCVLLARNCTYVVTCTKVVHFLSHSISRTGHLIAVRHATL